MSDCGPQFHPPESSTLAGRNYRLRFVSNVFFAEHRRTGAVRVRKFARLHDSSSIDRTDLPSSATLGPSSVCLDLTIEPSNAVLDTSRSVFPHSLVATTRSPT